MKKKIREALCFMLQNTPVRQEREHVLRVCGYALIIIRKKHKCDKKVLITAALLHDMGRTPLAQEHAGTKVGKGHAARGAAVARVFLQKEGWRDAQIERICSCIRAHSRNGKDKLRTMEEKILFDADKLDLCGPTGLARIIGFSHEGDRPFSSLMRDGFLEDAGESAQSLLQECENIAASLPKQMYTKRGKQLANEKIKTLERYTYDLEKESKMLEKILEMNGFY